MTILFATITILLALFVIVWVGRKKRHDNVPPR